MFVSCKNMEKIYCVFEKNRLNGGYKQNKDKISKNKNFLDLNLNPSPSEDPSSSINIKKEIFLQNSFAIESSSGFNAPSVHDIMTDKATMSQICTKKIIDYTSNVDGARPGGNLAVMDLDSDPSD
ncbi:hypothetical protein AYI70_g6366 [Smittium culicis]|uniref:Uncharacterized protein n=1 Tax=Smittium culicis TaxID=133412 RepID=A0A1R1XQB9_9FUNG|nr:hypothetical protein AYI70_g6366 [Smittium culicis]